MASEHRRSRGGRSDLVTRDPCEDCNGSRAVPDDFGQYEDGYAPCPSCVIDTDHGIFP